MKRLWLAILLLLVSTGLAQAQSTVQLMGGSRWIPLADVTVGAGGASTIGSTTGAGNRVALVCTNTDSSNNVRIGGTTAPTATRGVQLRPGASITITARTTITAITEANTAVVACSEELR